jgi:RiboL-PSP-HEPN
LGAGTARYFLDMSRYSTSYAQFLERMEEIRLLRRSAVSLEKNSPFESSAEINALCRAGIVLLTSHIEGYVKDIGESALDTIVIREIAKEKLHDRFFYHVSKKKIDTIREAGDPTKIVGHIRLFLQDDISFWSEKGPFKKSIPTEVFNDGFSTPTFEKVCKYFLRFGYDRFRVDFMQKLRQNGVIVQNAIDDIVSTRNSIAHGDMHQNRTPSDFEKMEESARLFCRSVDEVFCSWFKKNLCSLRR